MSGGPRWLGPAVVGLNLLLVASVMDVGWVPHDEGLFGQSAERALYGERPHVDFREVYSGGLTYLNALSFYLFGIHSLSLRLVMLPFFAGFLSAIWGIARRFVGPMGSAGLTSLGALLTLYQYSAPMPSWYTLYFATMGLWVLLRNLDRPSPSGWWLAGLIGGVSMLFKITALHWIAAVGLVLLEQERIRSAAASLSPTGVRFRSRAFSALKIGLLALVGIGCSLVLRQPETGPWLWHVGVPLGSAIGYVALQEWRGGGGAPLYRLRALARDCGVLALGFLLPVTLFAMPYALDGELYTLFRGVFVLPSTRLSRDTFPLPEYFLLPPLPGIALGIPLLLLLGWGLWRHGRDSLVPTVIAALVAVGLLLGTSSPDVLRLVFLGLRQVFPLLGLMALWQLSRHGETGGLQVFAVVTAAGLQSLVQIPFAGPMYFLHAAPLAPLAWAALVNRQRAAPLRLHGVLLAFLLLFVVTRLGWPSVALLRGDRRPSDRISLGLSRSTQRVDRPDAFAYPALVEEVAKHAGPGEAILALPDCPEVYFLTGTRNPTPTIYEAFEDPADLRMAHLVEVAAKNDVRVVVLQEQVRFYPPIPEGYRAAFAELFPNQKSIALSTEDPSAPPQRWFTVYWR